VLARRGRSDSELSEAQPSARASQDGAAHLESDEKLLRALQLAYQYLNRRDRTVSEVRRHLGHHGSDGSSVEDAIQVLTEEGLLDDRRYARLFSQDKRELEQWGSERIRRGLLDRGIDRELVDDALAAVAPEDELERALALLGRRFAVAPTERRERDRALGMLLRKGYDSDLALDALAAYARRAGESDQAA
jgi:regulatory protein